MGGVKGERRFIRFFLRVRKKVRRPIVADSIGLIMLTACGS